MATAPSRTDPAALPLERFDAVLFDLDGVVTDTASIHAAAWKRVFDGYLAARARRTGEEQPPFDADGEYRLHVDGRPRYDGAAAFLASRGISLPRGAPEDPPGTETVCGIANGKDAEFRRRLSGGGAEPFAATVALIDDLRRSGIRTGVFSASRNCEPVLRSAGVEGRFDTRVDGVDADAMGMPGKPDPAMLLEAARRLSVPPERTAVVEDALAGVEAGRRGGFGLVIGIDRAGRPEDLRTAGADVVVADLSEVALVRPETPSRGPWFLLYEGFDPKGEGVREALCTTGNGYFATRGAAPEARADGVHYPGTYAAGVFNRLATRVGAEEVENESLVNLPNWLSLTFRIEGGPWFSAREADLLDHSQELDLRRGVLTRRLRFRDREGRTTSVVQRRFTSMAEPHLAALETTIRAEDWSGRVEVRSAIDGEVENAGVARYSDLEGRHLEAFAIAAADERTISLRARTSQSEIVIGMAARTALTHGGPPEAGRRVVSEGARIAHEVSVDLSEGEAVTVEKVAALYTSRDAAISEPTAAAVRTARDAGLFETLLEAHVVRLDHLWSRLAIEIEDGQETSFVLNLHIFHLMQTVSPNTLGLDVGVPARGLHGEAYRGHIFWDELFVFPFLTLNLPDLTRSLLHYRHRRLPEARRAAREEGLAGALFPWQSGSDGREESQSLHLNPRSGRWLRDNSHLQRHINMAIAYNVWQYHESTGDIEFLSTYGAELMLEIARLCASLAEYDHARDRYVIRGVMGPDEYHDAYPWEESPGLDNNTYTNVMAVWVLCRALDLLEELPEQRRAALSEDLGLTRAEIDRWDDVSRRMFIPFHDGVLSQFEGYERLEELDWAAYRERHGDIQRLDRILEAEGDTPNRYRASKQADVLMLLFLLSAEQLEELVTRLGYDWEPELIPRSIEYYAGRTSHGSTLSRVVHSWVLARADRSRSWELFRQALRSDVADTQGGTTAEGIHLGAMAGTVDLVTRGYTGIEPRGGTLWLNPSVPPEITCLTLSIRYLGHWGIRLRIADGRVRLSVPPSNAPPITVGLRGKLTAVGPGETFDAPLEPGEGG